MSFRFVSMNASRTLLLINVGGQTLCMNMSRRTYLHEFNDRVRQSCSDVEVHLDEERPVAVRLNLHSLESIVAHRP